MKRLTSYARSALHVAVRRLGIARSRRVVRFLRDARLYVPGRLLYENLSPHERRRYRELRGFRRRHGRVFGAITTPESPSYDVLFPQVAPGLDRLRVEAMVAKGLQVRGCRPIFLVDRHDLWHEEHLRAFGFRDFAFIDDHLPLPGAFTTEAQDIFRGCRTQEDVLSIRFRGFEVGRHAASGVLKRLRRGTADPTEADFAEQFPPALAYSMRVVVAVERILDEVRPDKLVTSVQNYTPWAEFFEGALKRGIDTLHWGRSHLENAFLFQRYTYDSRNDHFVTISDETWDDLKRMPWSAADADALVETIRTNYLQPTWLARKGLAGKRPKSADEIRASLGLDPAKKTAFIFSHLLYDATFWFGTSLFADYSDWLVETVAAACENPNLNWVVKLHPENVRRWRQATGRYAVENLQEWQLLNERFGELPPHVRLMPPEDDTSTVSLFDFADYVLTVRGTVGLEFPCFGVPTITAGEGGYSGRGFTLDSATRADYFALLGRLHEVPRLDDETVALAQRFAHGVLDLKPVRVTSFSWMLMPEHEHDPGLSAWRYELLVSTPEQLRSAPDLARIADWAVDSDARDLLGSWPEAADRPALVAHGGRAR